MSKINTDSNINTDSVTTLVGDADIDVAMSAPRQNAKKARSPREPPANNDDDSQTHTTRQIEKK
jgi:hypothetical protein